MNLDIAVMQVFNGISLFTILMLMAIGLGAPAGYALARYDFKGQDLYRVLIVMTRAFPLAILALQSLSSGRAAILGYTMPIFAALWGLALYGQRLGPRQRRSMKGLNNRTSMLRCCAAAAIQSSSNCASFFTPTPY